MNRRQMLATTGAAALMGALAGRAGAQERTIVVAGAGGVLAQVTREVYELPFTAKTGIKVKAVASDNYLGKLKAMQETKNIEWDATECRPEDYSIVLKNGWLEPIDWAYLDPKSELPAVTRASHGVVAAAYSLVLAVRTDKDVAGKRPATWRDFWDTKTFPGPRTLQDGPARNLEFALIADGVAPADVYKALSADGGIDRAFKKLDEVKPHIVTWWKGAAQPLQMLESGEVIYASALNGRVSALAEKKVPVEIAWNGGALMFQYLVIPKGAKDVKGAHEYIKHTFLDPAANAEFTRRIKYPGPNPKIYDLLPAALGPTLPTYPANLAAQFAFDGGWWSERLAALQERWTKWLLAR